MLRALIRFSIDYASLVIMAAILTTAWAAIRLPSMSVDVFPELNAPTVVVMTEAGGLSADEVEQYVTFRIESAVNGMTGVRRVRSASGIGLSIIWVDLDWGANLLDARQLVSERLDAVRDHLPEEAEPFITPMSSIAGEIMLIALSSPDGATTPSQLRSIAEFEFRTSLLAIPGIAQVVAIGGALPEYQVNVDQERLQLYGLTISDVADAAGDAHSTASAGYLPDANNLELPIRQQTRVQRPEDIADTIVAFHEGVAVTIGQVADVGIGPAMKRGEASEGGRPAVILSIQKSPGTNTLLLTKEVDRVLDQLVATLPAGARLNRDVFRQSHFIERSVTNVVRVLIEAALIVAVILILFLMNVRTTIITLVAIPVSLAVALLLMDGTGIGLNVMTIGGLTVAIGVLVDDAIINVENVDRRLRQHALAGAADPRSLPQIIFDACNEIRSAIVFATIIIVIVFVPLLFLQGLEGRFFRPLALTYMVSIGASLLVALTLTPALCTVLLRRSGTNGESRTEDAFFVRHLKRLYEPCLRSAIRLRKSMLVAALLLIACSLWLASTFGSAFLPSFNEGTFTVFLMAPPGTSLDESHRLASNVERQFIDIEGVETVARRTGRAERDEHAEPVSSSEIEVVVAPGYDRETIRMKIDTVLGAIPGITTMIGQPIEHRLSHILSGTPAAIAISVRGDDLTGLRRVAKSIETALASVPGARDVNASREMLITTVPVKYDHRALAATGLTPASAARQLRQAIHGEVVDTINQGARQYDLVVRLAPEHRERVEQIENLLLHGEGGATVRLRDVAQVGLEQASNLITRENAQRKSVVSLNIAEGHNLGTLVEEVSAIVNPIVEKAGFTVHYGGQFEAQQQASRTILVAGVVVALIMLMLLQLSTGSWRAAILVMLNLPLALVGGVAAIYIFESPSLLGNTLALFGFGSAPYIAPVVSIASLVGFITLFGIAVRNGILLINHYNHLVNEEGVPLSEAILRGSIERLVPILMTALTAALGLLPLALSAGEPGSELLAPLAIVTLGGLLSSTMLNLLVVPAGYALIFPDQREST